MTRKLYRTTLLVQGIYSFITAVWGLIDIDSFMAVTGPKTDIWLVKTVSVLLVAIGGVLIVQFLVNRESIPVALLGLFTSVGLAVIDFHYSGNGTISKVYALDGIAEVVFALCWLVVIYNWKRLGGNHGSSSAIDS